MPAAVAISFTRRLGAFILNDAGGRFPGKSCPARGIFRSILNLEEAPLLCESPFGMNLSEAIPIRKLVCPRSFPSTKERLDRVAVFTENHNQSYRSP